MSRLELFRIGLRSFFIQGTWNYERMLGLGYCFCMIPFVKKSLRDKRLQVEFFKQNLEYFNTQPYLASWILGATAKLYEESWSKGKPSTDEIARFKKHFGQSLAAMGDPFFWSYLRPISAMLGVALALYQPVLGILVFLLLYNIPHLYMRFTGVFTGYRKGFDVLKDLSMNKFKCMLDNLCKLAAFLTGLNVIIFAHLSLDFIQVVAFLCAAFITYFFLRFNLAISYALIIVITVIVIFGSL